MADRRAKLWLLATLVLGLLGFAGVLFLIGSMANSLRAPARAREEKGRSLLQARARNAALADNLRLTESYDRGNQVAIGSRASSEDCAQLASRSSSDADSNCSVGFKNASLENTTSLLHVDDDSARATLKRMLQGTTPVCDVPQPYVANCFTLFGEGPERTVQRLAQAVGHLEIPGDRVSCSGVLLDGGSKTSMYFLTAAQCLPNEKRVTQTLIHFTGCAGTNTYTKNKMYAINRRLGYVILRIETNAAELRATYGALHLRPTTSRTYGEKVFLAHYSTTSPVKRLTTQLHQHPITIEPFVASSDCVVISPQSRVAYAAPLMDSMAIGAPVISLDTGTIVAIHLCGDCSYSSHNSGLWSRTILVDLDNQALSIEQFSGPAR